MSTPSGDAHEEGESGRGITQPECHPFALIQLAPTGPKCGVGLVLLAEGDLPIPDLRSSVEKYQ